MRPAGASFLAVLCLATAGGCIEPLQTEADFSGPSAPCVQTPDLPACKAAAACVQSGRLWCKDLCVDMDSGHCGSCDTVCKAGVCEAGRCVECSVRVADTALDEPALAPGEVVLPLDCPNLPANELMQVRLDATLATAHLQDDCRKGSSQTVSWALEVDAGERIAFSGNVHASGPPDALQAVHQLAERMPVAPDGHLRAQVRILQGHVEGCPARVRLGLSSTLTIRRMQPAQTLGRPGP